MNGTEWPSAKRWVVISDEGTYVWESTEEHRRERGYSQ